MSAEYVGILALTVSVVAALVGSGLGETVADTACGVLGKLVSVECAGQARDDAKPVALAPPPAQGAVPDSGRPPRGAAGTVPDPPPSERERYTNIFCAENDLDCSKWNTAKGVSCNDDFVQAVYDLYRDLNRRNPELQWAAQARLAGGIVYPGLQDIHALRKAKREGRSGLPVVNERDLEYFEDKLVSMQKQIFEDIGWQLMAYSRGGIQEMRRLHRAGKLPATDPRLHPRGMIGIWEDIASGDPRRVREGNRQLLLREQRTILQDDYDEMRKRGGNTWLYLQALSLTAQSPVPGGKSFNDFSRSQVCVKLPSYCSDTFLPPGTIDDFDERWEWIDKDMLPAYYRLPADRLRGELARPLSERARSYRMLKEPYKADDGLC